MGSMSTEHHDDQDQDPTEGAARRPRRLLGALVVTMFASWLLLMAPLPFSLAAGITALAALVLLVLVSVQSLREGRWGMAALGVLVGVPATLMIVAGSVISLLFYGPMSEAEECRSTAITEQAQVQCEAEAQNSMAGWISGLLGG